MFDFINIILKLDRYYNIIDPLKESQTIFFLNKKKYKDLIGESRTLLVFRAQSDRYPGTGPDRRSAMAMSARFIRLERSASHLTRPTILNGKTLKILVQ